MTRDNNRDWARARDQADGIEWDEDGYEQDVATERAYRRRVYAKLRADCEAAMAARKSANVAENPLNPPNK